MSCTTFLLRARPAARAKKYARKLAWRKTKILIFHSSNLRPLKRIDLLLETVARIRPRDSFRLLVLAGGSFEPFIKDVERLKLNDRVIVRENVYDIEDYLQAADIGLFTSESESFGLSILEAMFFGCPSVARQVGGIPEVIENNVSGVLVPSDNPDALAHELNALIQDPPRRAAMAQAAQRRARDHFSAEVIVPRYEALYRRLCSGR